jgi:hypothetical protein
VARKKTAAAPAHLCEKQRGKAVCGLPAAGAPEPILYKGKLYSAWLCFRCKRDHRQQTLLTVINAQQIPIQRKTYHEDAHGNMWLADLVRFYLMGVEGILVNRVGQMDRRHIDLWFERTSGDKHSWAETQAKFEREEKIRAGKTAVADGDKELAAMHQLTVLAMRRESDDPEITGGEEHS